MKFLYIYLAAVSLISIVITIADKIKAKRHAWRIPEAALLGWSALGGSIAMFITMLLIRHKTKHAKFMIGIPIIMILHAALVICYFYFLR